ncbi:MAG: DNA-directed RNA polymerase subunit A', partial [Nanoarchaeota archaeon]
MKLTVPERVNEWNINYLKEFVRKGPKSYPGANYVVRPDGKKKKLTDDTVEASIEELQPGYIVERHLMDGDIAIFNRQPSLHRMSMMCHIVRVLPCKTLRLNPAVCFPYNADFDGDEMNLHIPQTEEARAEAELLTLVDTQMISPRYGLSVIGCIQDAISGNYILTRNDFSMTRSEAIDLLASVGVTDVSRLPKKDAVSGKEIFSVLLPDDFSFAGRSKSREEPDVVIRSGRVVSGVMDKNNLGEGSGLLLRNLHKKYGKQFALDVLGKMFKLGIAVLMRRGFTTALSDTDLPQEAKLQIQTVFQRAEQAVAELIAQYNSARLDILPGRTLRETLELKILEVLNKARDETGKIVAINVESYSHTVLMAISGARGTPLNLAQMAGCVGQQALRGKRIENGYNGRTLSCFRRDDLSPEARGFIKSSFKAGLKPAEFFFQSIVGRDALMDTALRTPKSGYLYRRLANALQDLKVDYDETVRDSGGRIVQFVYGEDGIDVSKSEGGVLNIKRVVDEVLEK